MPDESGVQLCVLASDSKPALQAHDLSAVFVHADASCALAASQTTHVAQGPDPAASLKVPEPQAAQMRTPPWPPPWLRALHFFEPLFQLQAAPHCDCEQYWQSSPLPQLASLLPWLLLAPCPSYV